MSKTHKCTVVNAFTHEGKIRTPGKPITLSETDAKALLERGKVKLAGSASSDDDETGGAAKAKAGAAAKAKAKAGDSGSTSGS